MSVRRIAGETILTRSTIPESLISSSIRLSMFPSVCAQEGRRTGSSWRGGVNSASVSSV